mmetsp:Transcript_32943/g.38136  ORF Transcript_32943/g.38136 Transcript_32943/m.38136 type:complete len:326 (+) Transcript_32943:44-1021(+)
MENILMIFNTITNYLTGNFDYAAELRGFFMAVQASMAVRNGRNKQNKMAWFHAFMASVFAGFAGGTFAPMLMGRPSLMLSSDINFCVCTLAFILVNYTPFDIGYKIVGSFPGVLVYTLFAQLFRVNGLISFNSIAFEAFKNSPSKYYPIPIVGPIIFPIILANMGGFFAKGIDGHLKNGMPWPIQNGIFCATLYHFYVNDQTGVIGVALRENIANACDLLKNHITTLVPDLEKAFGSSLSEQQFAFIAVSAFMHVTAVLQLPYFFGSSFNPFVSIFSGPIFIFNALTSFLPSNTSKKIENDVQAKSTQDVNTTSKRKKSKGKKQH